MLGLAIRSPLEVKVIRPSILQIFGIHRPDDSILIHVTESINDGKLIVHHSSRNDAAVLYFPNLA